MCLPPDHSRCIWRINFHVSRGLNPPESGCNQLHGEMSLVFFYSAAILREYLPGDIEHV